MIKNFDIFIKLNENVLDKYIKKNHSSINVDDFPGFEEKYNKNLLSGVKLKKLEKDGFRLINNKKQYFSVYENPINIIGFEPNVRAILLKNGDLYVAEKSDILHSDIAMALFRNKIIKNLPGDIYKYPNDYILLIRRDKTNTLELSKSFNKSDVDFNNIKSVFNTSLKKINTTNKFKIYYSTKIQQGS